MGSLVVVRIIDENKMRLPIISEFYYNYLNSKSLPFCILVVLMALRTSYLNKSLMCATYFIFAAYCMIEPFLSMGPVLEKYSNGNIPSKLLCGCIVVILTFRIINRSQGN